MTDDRPEQVNEQYVLVFDYRSDGGPRMVGPFPTRAAAFAHADAIDIRHLGSLTATFEARSLTAPEGDA